MNTSLCLLCSSSPSSFLSPETLIPNPRTLSSREADSNQTLYPKANHLFIPNPNSAASSSPAVSKSFQISSSLSATSPLSSRSPSISSPYRTSLPPSLHAARLSHRSSSPFCGGLFHHSETATWLQCRAVSEASESSTKWWERWLPWRDELSQDEESDFLQNPPRIELENTYKQYGDRMVVEDVSIHLNAGEVVGLLGPNGAGKSTAFSLLVGRERPTKGTVKLGSRDITKLPLELRARLGVGYLPQEASIFRGLTVRDNILLVLQETGVPRANQEARIQELLREFGLEQVSNTRGRSLSGGERRRAELARALAANWRGGPPRILFVDEPFSGVDPIGVQEIQAMLRTLCERDNIGIFITDHNVIETLRICDRAYMMHRGRVMAQGTPQELYGNAYVTRHYLGEGYVRHMEPRLSSTEPLNGEASPAGSEPRTGNGAVGPLEGSPLSEELMAQQSIDGK